MLEYIASEDTCGAKALFATHYHELSELEGQLSGVKNYRISVKEIGDNILFLRKIVRGSADKSFGVQVARLAGIPEEVISRAGQILEGLESSDMATMHKSGRIKTVDDSEISVDKSEKQVDNSVDKAVLADLKAIDLENMTPMMALQKLYAYHDAWRED